ncbi:MAG: hypothetical protein HQ538_06075 [Parcubacteria group bacterium]|nr:hypothetical protein [Parcubacteria group bacterium]
MTKSEYIAEIREISINEENIIKRFLTVLLAIFSLFLNEIKNLIIQSSITNPIKISDRYRAALFHSIKCPSMRDAPVSKT